MATRNWKAEEDAIRKANPDVKTRLQKLRELEAERIAENSRIGTGSKQRKPR